MESRKNHPKKEKWKKWKEEKKDQTSGKFG